VGSFTLSSRCVLHSTGRIIICPEHNYFLAWFQV